MSRLIGDSVFNTIRGVLADVTDTFMRTPVTYKRDDKETTTASQRNVSLNISYTDFNFLALIVWNKDHNAQEFNMGKNGAVDMATGKVVANMKDVAAVNLFDGSNNNPGHNERDLISFDDTEYRVIGVRQSGPLNNENVLVNIYFRKLGQNG